MLKGNFIYRGSALKIVSEYLYLGILFTTCGSFSRAVSRLCDQAKRAMFKLRQINLRNSVQTLLRLFQALIMPILSYGAEVWGPHYFKGLKDSNLLTLCNREGRPYYVVLFYYVENVQIASKLCNCLLNVVF